MLNFVHTLRMVCLGALCVIILLLDFTPSSSFAKNIVQPSQEENLTEASSILVPADRIEISWQKEGFLWLPHFLAVWDYPNGGQPAHYRYASDSYTYIHGEGDISQWKFYNTTTQTKLGIPKRFFLLDEDLRTSYASSYVATFSTMPPPKPLATDDARFIADVTLPDGSYVTQGQTLKKTWQLRNTGTSKWDQGYQLVFIGGNQLQAPNAIDVPSVSPDQIADISILWQLPTNVEPANYTGAWQLRNPQGQQFGDIIWFNLNVISDPPLPTDSSPTPRPPTVTPQPQSCTNPPPDTNVAYLFDNENCVNPWNWSSGHPSDSANRNAKSAWLPAGKVLLLSANNDGSEPTICLRAPVQKLADIGWGNRVEWASLRDSCPESSGPNRSPGTPQLSSPGDWSEVRSADGPELCWQAVSDPDGDAVQYQVDILESAVIDNSGWVNGTCWRSTRLAGQYYGYQWRVKAKDSRGAESGWSDRRHFTLSAPAWNPPPPTPTPQFIPTQNPVSGNWWHSDYAYRRPLLITTNGQVAAGTLIKVDNVDIDALVSQGRVRSDYNDLRVVQRLDESHWQEVARVVYSGWDLEFQLPTTLSATTDNTYYLYYGNPNAGAPPTFSLPQGWWVDMHKTKWWDSLAGTWEQNQAMDFDDVCSAPLNHRDRVGTTFDDSDRFRGRLFIPATGTWTFQVYTNDGYYLNLDGGEVGHDHGYSGNRWATIGSRSLKAGWHKFDAGDMWVNCGAWKLTMAGPGFANQIIPAHFFQKSYDNVKDGIGAGAEEPYLLPTPTATPEPDCDGIQSTAVILFQDLDCHGSQRHFAAASIYNVDDFDNLTSAIYVPAGWSVRVYAEANGLGDTYCARESKWNLALDRYEAGGPVINDTISAIEVFANATCAPSVQLTEPLTLTPHNPTVGEFITASYTIKNVGAYTLYLHGVGVVARGPDCNGDWDCAPVQDFPVHEAIALAPGDSYRYTAVRTYTATGDGYFAEAAFANRNWWWYGLPGNTAINFSVSPGLELVEDLVLSPANLLAGEAVTARYRLRNASDHPLHFQLLSVAMRGPDCQDWSCPLTRDFPWHNNVTLQPGEEHAYAGALTFTTAGDGYFAQILYKIGPDDWQFLGERHDFTVAEGLTLVEPLTLAPAQPIAGQPVYARYVLENRGGRPITVQQLGIIARGSACNGQWDCTPGFDFPAQAQVTIQPGTQYTYEGWRSFDIAAGNYSAEPALADENWWWTAFPGVNTRHFTIAPGLRVVNDLLLTPQQPLAGESVTATFTLQNDSDQSITLYRLLVATRGPNCTDWRCTNLRDFPWRNAITIAPGANYTYQGKLSFTAPGGGYFAQILYKFGEDDWQMVGTLRQFTVEAGLTLTEPLTLAPPSAVAGEPVTARFVIRNRGSHPLTLKSLGVVARGPECTDDWRCEPNRDFPGVMDLVLAPNQSYVYSQTQIFTEAGAGYFAEPSFADGQWWWYMIDGGQRVAFAVQAPVTVTITPQPSATPTTQAPPIATPTTVAFEPSATPTGQEVTATPTPVVTATLTATPTAPPEGFCTISLATGDLYSNRLDLPITIQAPDATQVLLTNDGGFAGTTWQTVQPTMTWRLRDPGSEIATLLVQARFRRADGQAACNGAVVFDDIIYDPLSPTIARATYTHTVQTAQGRAPTTAGYLVIAASDQPDGSGLAQLQISTDPTFAAAAWQPYAATVAISEQLGDRLFVRVRDRAGNISATTEVLIEKQATDTPIFDHIGLITLTVDAQLEGILYWQGTADDPPDGFAAVGADPNGLIVAWAEHCQAPTESALGTCQFALDLRGYDWDLMGFIEVEDGTIHEGVGGIVEEQVIACLRVVDNIAVSNDSCPFVERPLSRTYLPWIAR